MLYSDPQKLARSAEDLLRIAVEAPLLTSERIAAIELSAVLLCNQVREWHARAGLPNAAWRLFVQRYPSWKQLNAIANGTTQPSTMTRQERDELNHATVKPPEGSGRDFWMADTGYQETL